MQLSDVMEGMHRDGDDVVANVGEEWLQGRSVFGGLQAAIAVAAMRTQVDAALPLRTLQVTFVAPVPAGGVRARAVVLRRGGSATQVEARIVAGDQVLLLAVGIFALMPALDSPEAGSRMVPGWQSLHATFILLSYGAFGLGALTGGMYLMEANHLKNHKARALASLLPPITRVEAVTAGSLLAGVGLLAGSLARSAPSRWSTPRVNSAASSPTVTCVAARSAVAQISWANRWATS